MASDEGQMNAIQQKIDTAAQRKIEGNEAFKAGDLETAMRCYHEIKLYISGLDNADGKVPTGPTTKAVTEEQKATIQDLMLSHNLNLAAIYVKKEKYEKGERVCSEALKIKPDNVKGLFRRGKCRSELGDLDGAKEDFERAVILGGEDAQVKREMKVLEHRLKLHEKKERKRYAGMFDSAPETKAQPVAE
mmetsp:Transcript_43595/g.83175  ORF Transcript_43595/g.83175 Transcript_43595/m.83175 type:complete len:190 (-) Transcript_43595:247-816(-)|eukprot:CAMPEP_0114235016 /NCGR_PEP_ID=MMETSP0058-20121206/6015_1 /TAXON_ID=36894 /ORGANISM="Pyramimonas parkeae, CCMP726" /LENGTH=189 /DNA_ID=CAMNT_0001346729 /DNA_START=54 /DNA_END=623 /DNA_ORIENTATION=-